LRPTRIRDIRMDLKSLRLNKILTQVLHLVFFFVCFSSCNRPLCENTNPIFDEHQPTSKEYKLELIKQLSIIDKSKLTYWFKEYTEYDNEELLHFHIQSKELCAILVLNVEQWGRLEQIIREKKGVGRRGAQFTNLQFEIVQDTLSPKFIYKNFSRMID